MDTTFVMALTIFTLLLLIFLVLLIAKRYNIDPTYESYVRQAIVIVYEVVEKEMKAGNILNEKEKLALVELTYYEVLPPILQAQITLDAWGVIVERGYQDAIRIWNKVGDRLMEEFAEWEANEK